MWLKTGEENNLHLVNTDKVTDIFIRKDGTNFVVKGYVPNGGEFFTFGKYKTHGEAQQRLCELFEQLNGS